MSVQFLVNMSALFLAIVFFGWIISLYMKKVNTGAHVYRAWIIFFVFLSLFIFSLQSQIINVFVRMYGACFIPLLGISICFMLARYFGKEPKGRGIVIHEYTPPYDLLPGEMSYLMDQRVSHRLIVATILDLVRRHYLQLSYPVLDTQRKMNGQSSFITKARSPVDLKPFEQEIWKGLFLHGGSRASFSEALPAVASAYGRIEDALLRYFLEQNIFSKDERWARVRWMIHGYAMLVLTWLVLSAISGLIAKITFWIMIPAIFFMAWQMPNRTSLGSRYVEACLGFKRFLKVTEIMRLQTTDHPKLSPKTFSFMLPYAIALGIEKDWKKAIPFFNI